MITKKSFIIWSIINVMLLGVYVVFLFLDGFLSISTSVISIVTFLSITLMMYMKYRNKIS